MTYQHMTDSDVLEEAARRAEKRGHTALAENLRQQADSARVAENPYGCPECGAPVQMTVGVYLSLDTRTGEPVPGFDQDTVNSDEARVYCGNDHQLGDHLWSPETGFTALGKLVNAAYTATDRAITAPGALEDSPSGRTVRVIVEVDVPAGREGREYVMAHEGQTLRGRVLTPEQLEDAGGPEDVRLTPYLVKRARDWAEHRTDIADRESAGDIPSSEWQSSDDEAAEIAHMVAEPEATTSPKCSEGDHVNDDNPGQPACKTCSEWIVTQRQRIGQVQSDTEALDQLTHLLNETGEWNPASEYLDSVAEIVRTTGRMIDEPEVDADALAASASKAVRVRTAQRAHTRIAADGVLESDPPIPGDDTDLWDIVHVIGDVGLDQIRGRKHAEEICTLDWGEGFGVVPSHARPTIPDRGETDTDVTPAG